MSDHAQSPGPIQYTRENLLHQLHEIYAPPRQITIPDRLALLGHKVAFELVPPDTYLHKGIRKAGQNSIRLFANLLRPEVERILTEIERRLPPGQAAPNLTLVGRLTIFVRNWDKTVFVEAMPALERLKTQGREHEAPLRLRWIHKLWFDFVTPAIDVEQERAALTSAAKKAGIPHHLIHDGDLHELRAMLWASGGPGFKHIWRSKDGKFVLRERTLADLLRRSYHAQDRANDAMTSLDKPAPSGKGTLADTMESTAPKPLSEDELRLRAALDVALAAETDRDAVNIILEWQKRTTESLDEVAGDPQMAKRARRCMERVTERARRLA